MRKRSIAVILTIILLCLLTGCKTIKNVVKAKSPDLNKSFTAEVVIDYDGSEIKGIVTRYGTGLWAMEITEPKSMAGLKINYDDDGVTASLGELNFNIPLEQVSNNAIFAQLFNAIDSAAALNELDYAQTENGVTYTGNTDYGTYILTFNPDNYTLTDISLPDMGIEIKVLSFSEIKSSPSETTTSSETVTSTLN